MKNVNKTQARGMKAALITAIIVGHSLQVGCGSSASPPSDAAIDAGSSTPHPKTGFGQIAPQGGVVVQVQATSGGGLAVTGTLAQPFLGLLTSCSMGQTLTWSGSAWACGAGGITNSAPANDIAMSDGTNIVAFGGKTCGSGFATGIGADGTLTCSTPTGLISGLTANILPKASSATAVTNSLAKDTGSQFSYNTNSFTVDTSGNGVFNGSLTADGASRVFDVAGTGLTSTTHTVSLNMAGASCSSGSFVTAINATGTATCTPYYTAVSGSVTRFTSGSTVGASSMTDDGTSVTIAGMKPTICTSTTNGSAGIVTLTIPDGCTTLIWTPTTNVFLVGITHPTSGSRHVQVFVSSSGGANFSVYTLNVNAAAADQFEGDLTGSPGGFLTINSSFYADYDTTNSKWFTNLSSDVGALSINGNASVFGNLTVTGTTGGRIDAHNTYTYTGGLTELAIAASSMTSISGSTVDWSPGTTFTAGATGILEIPATASTDLVSLTVPIAGMRISLCNLTAFDVTIENEGGPSVLGTASMRFKIMSGINRIGLPANSNECAEFYYSSTISRWVQTGGDPTIYSTLTLLDGINAQSSSSSIEALQVSNLFTVIGGALATFTGGLIGVNGATTTNVNYEWNDDWLNAPSVAVTSGSFAFGSTWYLTQSAAVGGFKGVAGHGRPGIMEISNGTGTSANIQIQTSSTTVDFGAGNWTFDTIIGFPVLSTTSGTGDATALIGFFDGITSINPTNGCYFVYDAANKITGGQNSGLTQDLQAVCQTGGSRTVYLLDGSGNCDASFVKGTVTIGAVTWPGTNAENLKVIMTGATEADFYANGVQVCKITSHIPASGTTMAAGWNLVSDGVGSQTAVPLDIDYSSLSVTLNAARSP